MFLSHPVAQMCVEDAEIGGGVKQEAAHRHGELVCVFRLLLHLFIPRRPLDFSLQPCVFMFRAFGRGRVGESAPRVLEDLCVNGPRTAHSGVALFKYRHQLLIASTRALGKVSGGSLRKSPDSQLAREKGIERHNEPAMKIQTGFQNVCRWEEKGLCSMSDVISSCTWDFLWFSTQCQDQAAECLSGQIKGNDDSL